MQKNAFFKNNLFNFVLIAIFILGIFLRAKGFLDNSSFWHDECALAWNIKFKSYSDFFGVLNFAQVAPPLFMILTKFLTSIFGFGEWVFRLVPFLISCLSIFVFYFLAQKVLNKGFIVLLAVFLFAINQTLINYAFEFKPYALDVFFAMVCILFFINLDIEKFTKKKLVLSSIFLAVTPWFSFVSAFIITAGVMNIFIKMYKNKTKLNLFPIAYSLLPLIVSGLIYLKIYALSNYTHNAITDYWQPYFITSIKHFLWMLGNNIKFFFPSVKFVLLALILLVWGGVIFYKEKSDFFFISMISFLCLILASILHIYPFMERLILFLLPIFLLFIVKPLDLISLNKKIVSLLIILIFSVTFYPQISLTKQLLTSEKFDKEEYAREMMATMIEKIKTEDKIFINSPSEEEFAYYSSFYDNKNIKIQEKIKNVIKDNYIKELNSLKPGNYWFYMPIDYHNRPTIPWIENWAKGETIIYQDKFNGEYPSLLMYVIVKREK